jgi:hypothetical protein
MNTLWIRCFFVAIGIVLYWNRGASCPNIWFALLHRMSISLFILPSPEKTVPKYLNSFKYFHLNSFLNSFASKTVKHSKSYPTKYKTVKHSKSYPTKCKTVKHSKSYPTKYKTVKHSKSYPTKWLCHLSEKFLGYLHSLVNWKVA